MRSISKLFFCFLLCVGSGWLSAEDSCLDSLTGLPKGRYINRHCENNICLEPAFHYDNKTDQLSLQQIFLNMNYEGTDHKHKTPFDPSAFNGNKTLPDACAWVKAGFDIDIDMHTDKLANLKFMLIPPQPEPDYELVDGEEKRNKLKEKDNFLLDIFVKGIQHSCSKFQLFVENDLILYRCRAEHKVESPFSLLPYFYQFQKGEDIPLVLENKNGTLSVVKVLKVKNTFSLQDFDFEQEIDRQCNARKLQKVEAPGGFMCHSERPDLLSEDLQSCEKHVVFMDLTSDYAVLHNCGDKAHLDVLMGVKQCFSRGLKLDYQERHHRFFCTPDKYREPKPGVIDDHSEL